MTDLQAENTPAPPRFVGGKSRHEIVELEYPIEYEGVTYERVTVRRMTTGEVAEYIERIRAEPEETRSRIKFPMFDLPAVVMDHLDDDDAERVAEVAGRFLPRRFQAAEQAT